MNNSPLPLPFDQLKPVFCKTCNGEKFEQVYFIRLIPALLSPIGRDLRHPFPAFQCIHCKTLLEFEEKKPNNLVKS